MSNSSCTACNQLNDTATDFIENGVTETICSSLADDTGFNSSSGRDSCDDMKDANECLTKTLHDLLPAFDTCDWKDYMEKYTSNDYNMKQAMICWMCGLQEQIYNLQLQNLSVETQYTIQQATPGLSVSIDRQGNFQFNYSDWINNGGYVKVADGVITGKANFCMKPNKDKSATYSFSSITIKHYSYKMTGVSAGSYPTISIRIPNQSGTLVYQKQTSTSFEEDINKTVEFTASGTIGSGVTTGWIQFLSIYVDWTEDDQISLSARFINSNQQNFPIC